MTQAKVSVAELRTVMDLLFRKLDELGVTHVDSEDLYWKVPLSALYDMTTTPELSVGSIADDVDELRKIGTDEYEASLTDIDRIVSLLRAMQHGLIHR